MASDHKARQKVKDWFRESANNPINPTEDNYIARDVLDIVERLEVVEEIIADLLISGRNKC